MAHLHRHICCCWDSLSFTVGSWLRRSQSPQALAVHGRFFCPWVTLLPGVWGVPSSERSCRVNAIAVRMGCSEQRLVTRAQAGSLGSLYLLQVGCSGLDSWKQSGLLWLCFGAGTSMLCTAESSSLRCSRVESGSLLNVLAWAAGDVAPPSSAHLISVCHSIQ